MNKTFSYNKRKYIFEIILVGTVIPLLVTSLISYLFTVKILNAESIIILVVPWIVFNMLLLGALFSTFSITNNKIERKYLGVKTTIVCSKINLIKFKTYRKQVILIQGDKKIIIHNGISNYEEMIMHVIDVIHKSNESSLIPNKLISYFTIMSNNKKH